MVQVPHEVVAGVPNNTLQNITSQLSFHPIQIHILVYFRHCNKDIVGRDITKNYEP